MANCDVSICFYTWFFNICCSRIDIRKKKIELLHNFHLQKKREKNSARIIDSGQ